MKEMENGKIKELANGLQGVIVDLENMTRELPEDTLLAMVHSAVQAAEMLHRGDIDEINIANIITLGIAKAFQIRGALE